ncbi:MAG: zf-HC2 domain-containing protein [Armatimonadetes bacterium]|nr:zf-HC2 domain-containing protein [Armatimonadota bacterium]
MLVSYTDGDLPDDLTRAVEAHIFSCEQCYREFRSLLDVRSTVETAPAPEPPAWLRGRIHASVAAAAERARPLTVRPAWAVASAAVLLMGLVAGVWLATVRQPATSPVVAPSTPQAQLAQPRPPTLPGPQTARAMQSPGPSAVAGAQAPRLARSPRAASRPERSPMAVARPQNRFRSRFQTATVSVPSQSLAAVPRDISLGSRGMAETAQAPPVTSATKPGPLPEAVGRPAPVARPHDVRSRLDLASGAPEEQVLPPLQQTAALPVFQKQPAPPEPARPEPAQQPPAVAEAPPQAPSVASERQSSRAAEKPAQVRVAELPSSSAPRWLPVRPADSSAIVVEPATDESRQLDELQQRLNQTLEKDAEAAGTGWIRIK